MASQFHAVFSHSSWSLYGDCWSLCYFFSSCRINIFSAGMSKLRTHLILFCLASSLFRLWKYICYIFPQHTDSEAETSMEQTVMGVHVIQKEGAVPRDDPEDISVLIEGVKGLSGLGNIAHCALLFGLISNLSYPSELKCSFEVLQKILLNLDGQRFFSKAQFLKNKLLGWVSLKPGLTDRSVVFHIPAIVFVCVRVEQTQQCFWTFLILLHGQLWLEQLYTLLNFTTEFQYSEWSTHSVLRPVIFL